MVWGPIDEKRKWVVQPLSEARFQLFDHELKINE